jgi:hypothetical protein
MTLPSTNGSCPADAQLATPPDSGQRGLNPFTATGSLRRAARLLSDDCKRSPLRDRPPRPTSLPLTAQSDHATDESARDCSGRLGSVLGAAHIAPASPSDRERGLLRHRRVGLAPCGCVATTDALAVTRTGRRGTMVRVDDPRR